MYIYIYVHIYIYIHTSTHTGSLSLVYVGGDTDVCTVIHICLAAEILSAVPNPKLDLGLDLNQPDESMAPKTPGVNDTKALHMSYTQHGWI